MEVKEMQKTVITAMESLGWTFVQVDAITREWRKFDKGGAPLSVQGSSIWHSDLDACTPTVSTTILETEQPVDKLDIVRVLRVLEYVGPRAWVENALERRAVKEIYRINADTWISEAFLGRNPEHFTGTYLEPPNNDPVGREGTT